MFRNLKTLGLALAAVFALSAAMASSAWAEEETTDAHFYSHEENTILTGHQEGTNVFSIGSTTVTCTTATAEGTVTGVETQLTKHQEETGTEEGPVYSATSVTVHPVYGNEEKNCQIKVGGTNFGKAKVDTTGCDYTLSAHTTTTEPAEEEHAKVSVDCGAEPIKITGPLGCTISVGSQGPLHGVRYSADPDSTETNDEAIIVDATVNGIAFTATSACGLAGVPEEGGNGVYEGGFTVEGFKDNNLTPHEPPYEEGPRIGIWWEPAEPTA